MFDVDDKAKRVVKLPGRHRRSDSTDGFFTVKKEIRRSNSEYCINPISTYENILKIFKDDMSTSKNMIDQLTDYSKELLQRINREPDKFIAEVMKIYHDQVIDDLPALTKQLKILNGEVDSYNYNLRKLQKTVKEKYISNLNNLGDKIKGQFDMFNNLSSKVNVAVSKALGLDKEYIKELEGKKDQLELIKLKIKDSETKIAKKEIELTKVANDLVTQQAKLANTEQERDNIKGELKTKRSELDDIKKTHKKELKEQKDTHKQELDKYKLDMKDVRQEHATYTKYFGKALHDMQKEGLDEIKDATKHQAMISKHVSMTARKSLKRIKQGKKINEDAWTWKTSAKLVAICLIINAILLLADAIICIGLIVGGGYDKGIVIAIGSVCHLLACIIIDTILAVSTAVYKASNEQTLEFEPEQAPETTPQQ